MAGRGSNLPSVMTKNFSKIPAPQIQRSVFNRTHGHKTTFDAGLLIPFFVDEILPGDTMSLKANIFARLATPIFPIMDNVFMDTFFFFVPNRLVWENWERFQGAQDNPDDPIDYQIPVLYDAGSLSFASNSIADYFGLPIAPNVIHDDDSPSALPFRAYNLIWNEWFRDQNLQGKRSVPLDDGPDLYSSLYSIANRGKRHDYFTSCLPWPQKGDSVAIPLGSIAPVIGNGTTVGFTDGTNLVGLGMTSIGGVEQTGTFRAGSYGDPQGTAIPSTDGYNGKTLGLTTSAADSGMIADLTNATAATINQLREAFAIQQILEMDARGGTRYVEHLRAHWGVISPDFRLQRPEYLGGGSHRVDVRGVPQTSSTDATSPQGNLAAYAQIGHISGFNKSFVEHGYVIGLVNVRADLTYQQGMRRMWSRSTRFDFYMPELAHLGEQAVLNKEIWFTSNNPTVNAAAFGYQERWAEYRYFPSMVTGLFRSDAAGTLDAWHLSIDFGVLPVLNAQFIADDPPIDRVIAVPSEPHVLFDSYIQIKHARPMPVYSIPGLQRL